LKPTVLAFTAEYASSQIPRFTPEVFNALELLLPALQVFLNLTQEYSKAEVNIHKSIKHTHLAIEKLQALKPKAAPARRASFEKAIMKLQKYINPMLQNNWICAAFALNPAIKEQGLANLFSTYGLPGRTQEVVDFIRKRMQAYQEEEAHEQEEEVIALREKEDSPEPFAASCSQQSQSSTRDDPSVDAWGEFNSRFATAKYIIARLGENILQHWKRQSDTNIRLRPLARVARDILGLASSSTSVERLFSQSGKTLGLCRARLSAEMLLKQTTLKVWARQQKVLTLQDIEGIMSQ
jgi:hypothetical protein